MDQLKRITDNFCQKRITESDLKEIEQDFVRLIQLLEEGMEDFINKNTFKEIEEKNNGQSEQPIQSSEPQMNSMRRQKHSQDIEIETQSILTGINQYLKGEKVNENIKEPVEDYVKRFKDKYDQEPEIVELKNKNSTAIDIGSFLISIGNYLKGKNVDKNLKEVVEDHVKHFKDKYNQEPENVPAETQKHFDKIIENGQKDLIIEKLQGLDSYKEENKISTLPTDLVSLRKEHKNAIDYICILYLMYNGDEKIFEQHLSKRFTLQLIKDVYSTLSQLSPSSITSVKSPEEFNTFCSNFWEKYKESKSIKIESQIINLEESPESERIVKKVKKANEYSFQKLISERNNSPENRSRD